MKTNHIVNGTEYEVVMGIPPEDDTETGLEDVFPAKCQDLRDVMRNTTKFEPPDAQAVAEMAYASSPEGRADAAEAVAANEAEDIRQKYQAENPAASVPMFKSITADNSIPKKIRWIWPNRFAFKLNMIVGNPDQGKGLTTYYLAAVLTTGQDWYDCKNTLPPSEILIMSGEEDWDDTIVPRLMAAGADLSKVHQLKMLSTTEAHNITQKERELKLDEDMLALEIFLKEHPKVRLVIVDPISNYLGGAKMIDEQSVRADILTPLKDLANARGIGVIGVMHLNKKVELDAIHRIGGAMAFVGVARMVWLCAPRPVPEGEESSDERVMVKVKGNIVHSKLKGLSYITPVRPIVIEGSPESIPYLKWTGEVNSQANELTGKAQPANPRHRPAEQLPAAIAWLTEYLKDGAKTVGEIESDGRQLCGTSTSTLRRARQDPRFVTFISGKKKRKGQRHNICSCRLSHEYQTALDAEPIFESQAEFDSVGQD